MHLAVGVMKITIAIPRECMLSIKGVNLFSGLIEPILCTHRLYLHVRHGEIVSERCGFMRASSRHRHMSICDCA